MSNPKGKQLATTEGSTHARRRPPLTRERIYGAAQKLADEEGLDAVSMRRVARALGVTPMSLYNHVDGKEALLDGLVMLVLGEFELPAPGADWEAALRRVARSAHEALLRHPWSAALIIQPPAGAGIALGARMAYIESILACLRRAGFSPELAYYGYHAIDSHILGFTMWLIGHQLAIGDSPEEAMQRVTLDRVPYLAEHARVHLERPSGRRPDFDFILDLLLEGLKRELNAGAT